MVEKQGEKVMAEMPGILQTERLLLRPLTKEDGYDLFDAFRDAETMQFMDSLPHRAAGETVAHLLRMISPQSCWWAITAKGSEQVIGFVGYLGNTSVPGMGYFLHRTYWRQGYMMEAVATALDHGFGSAPGLDLARVELWINDGNIASQRLAEKLGFARQGQFRMRYPHESIAHDKVVYGLYRYQWQAKPERVAVQPKACYGLQPILAVADVQATADFYCNQLDFTLGFLYGDPPTHGAVAWRDWSTDGAVIQLSHQPTATTARKETTLFLFVGPEIDKLYATYRARDVPIISELKNQPWGMREFTIADCNGYVLRVGTAI